MRALGSVAFALPVLLIAALMPAASSAPESATFCGQSGTVDSTGVVELGCALTTPSCGSCTVHYDVKVDGVGLVSGQFRTATCQSAVSCEGTGSETVVGSLTDACKARIDGALLGVTEAVLVTIGCTAWV